MKSVLRAWSILGVIATAAAVQAADLGDKAPSLAIAEWVKGAAVDISKNDGNQVYVVEFWATWCPPCRASIPHMTEMQSQFKSKNVTFIGISDEDAKTVKPFVKKMGAKMNYTVALDKNRKTAKAYMEAFGVRGIPHAFVIDKQGRIVWHGHPMDNLDKVVEQVVSGKFDLNAAREGQRGVEYINQYFQLVSSAGNEKAAAALGEKLMKAGANDARLMNALSWNIMTGRDVVNRDLKLALRAGAAANKASGGEDPSMLDTYAMALFKNGKKAEAIAMQEKAVKLANAKPQYEAMVKDLEQRLAEYRK